MTDRTPRTRAPAPSVATCGHLDQDWPKGPWLILLYPGNTQVDAAERYSTHARHLGKVSYVPVATSWGEEHPGVAVALFAVHLGEAGRVGTLLVTYRRDLV